MRICYDCNIKKPLEEFAYKNKSTGTRAFACKECHKRYAKEHFLSNKQYYKDKAKRHRNGLKNKIKVFILDYLNNNPCVDCGEKDVEILQFDHVEMVGQHGRRVSTIKDSLSSVIKEIEKCQVRCANCHVRRTRKMLGWSREI